MGADIFGRDPTVTVGGNSMIIFSLNILIDSNMGIIIH